MAQAQQSSSRTVSTVKIGELAVVVSVPSALVIEGEIPAERKSYDQLEPVTTYKDSPQWMDKSLIPNGYGDYEFVQNKGGGESIEFYFAKSKTKEQAIIPFHTQWVKFGNHRWCPLLKGLAFIEDPHFPLATNIIGEDGEQGIATAPRNYVREIFIQEVNEGSRFMLSEYIGTVPFNIARFPVPQPASTSYQINGVSGSIPEALRDDIEIPVTRSTTTTLIGDVRGVSTAKIPGQFFPRTNFRRRRPYVLAVDQNLQEGGYYMQLLRVFPPRQPRTTVQ